MNLLDLFFPKRCLECKKEGKYICKSCLDKVPVGGWYGNNYSVFRYTGVIRKVIISLKYKFATDVVDELVDVCVKQLKVKVNNKKRKFILVPIPLHKHRKNWRGFNQTEVLGEKLARKMKWEYIPNLLIKNKETIPQVNLKGIDRRKNLSDVFSLNPSLDIPKSLGVLLFDDVYTTGSTILKAKTVLNKGGFKRIYSLTVAR